MVRGEYYIMDRERESEREAKGTKEQTRGVGMRKKSPFLAMPVMDFRISSGKLSASKFRVGGSTNHGKKPFKAMIVSLSLEGVVW